MYIVFPIFNILYHNLVRSMYRKRTRNSFRESTDAAALPPNASRSFDDPFRKQSRWKKWAVALGVVCLAVLLAGGGYWGWKEYQKRHPAKQEQTSDIAAPKVPAPSAK